MSTTTSHFEIDAPLALALPDDGRLTVHAEDLALYREDGALTEARFSFNVPPEIYRWILGSGLFHLGQDALGPGAEGFQPDSDVRIEARLDASLLPGLAALGDDILVVGPAFASLASGSPLHETESWYALNVTIELLRDAEGGVLREGYTTRHAADQPAGRALRLPMLAIAAEALEGRGCDWQETTDDEVIRADVEGDNGMWACYVVAREEEQRCTVYSQAPWETPEEQRPAMAETITRINFGLPLGNFELDFADGEVRFKTSVDLNGETLNAELFEGLLDPNLSTMDAYLPALEAVRDGRLSPEAAVALVEG